MTALGIYSVYWLALNAEAGVYTTPPKLAPFKVEVWEAAPPTLREALALPFKVK